MYPCVSAGRAVRPHAGFQPDLADAAAHLGGLVAIALRHRRQRAAELDDIAVAILPIVEELEIRDNLVNGHRTKGSGEASRDIDARRAERKLRMSCPCKKSRERIRADQPLAVCGISSR